MTQHPRRGKLTSGPESRSFYPGYIEERELRKGTLLIYADFITNSRSLPFRKLVQSMYLELN